MLILLCTSEWQILLAFGANARQCTRGLGRAANTCPILGLLGQYSPYQLTQSQFLSLKKAKVYRQLGVKEYSEGIHFLL